MEFLKPQVNLTKHTHLDSPNEYFLHIITFTDNSQYCEDGYSIDDSSAESNCLIVVSIYINKNPDIPSLTCVTPITHTIKLGNLTFDNDGEVKVEVIFNNGTQQSTTQSNNETIVSTSDATEIDKPLDNDSVNSLWLANFGSNPTFL